ncbi:uncharacterized protein C8Q71DRAFT_888817 [Rhodofomes roseus]|uniref:F-box domain-containing protein n=1 Tax=Rhodofomes roseus TaxID=34475 RepID=A0ABQ8JZ98_9APHY|nr:uncharacterized protein C8Q71DRAFT_888817 [Rhodofomes roseus]KAH9829369.1 hypothetical protein C8Q71DRAFT_888817 [Rhodofomes roseus]
MQSVGDHGLNEDVWTVILAFTQLDDARNLSLVSRGIHPIARRIVLSSAEFSKQNQFVNACTFMLDDPGHRACWLRKLDINVGALGRHSWQTAGAASLATQLAALLEAARNIDTLSLPSMEDLVSAEPRVGATLISLTRLQDIALFGVSSRTLDVANKMVSRPSQVCLAFVSPRASVSEHAFLLSHLALLERARRAEIMFLDAADSTDELKQPSDLDVELPQLGQHPCVRELSLKWCGPFPMFHIFPNTQILRMRRLNASFGRFDWRTWAWTESVPLIDVKTDDDDKLVCLTAGGPRLPVLRRLHLRWNPCPSPQSPSDRMQPVCLSFMLYRADVPLYGQVAHWLEPLRRHTAPSGRLRYLTISARCLPRLDMPSLWVEWLLPAIRESQLVCVKLKFDVGNRPREVAGLDEVREMLAWQVPSLRYISIAAGWHRLEHPFARDDCEPRLIGECTWWEVREVGGGRRAELISCAAGQRVERYLQSAEFEEKLSLDGFVLT